MKNPHIIFTLEGAKAVNMPEKHNYVSMLRTPHFNEDAYNIAVKEAIANGVKFEDQDQVKDYVTLLRKELGSDSYEGIAGHQCYPIPSGYKVVVTPVAITRSGIESKEKVAKLVNE